MTEAGRFAPLTEAERLARDVSPDIAGAIDVNGIAFHLTGVTFPFDAGNRSGTIHVATIARACRTDDLSNLHGVTLPIGKVAGVERFCTMDQSVGMQIGILISEEGSMSHDEETHPVTTAVLNSMAEMSNPICMEMMPAPGDDVGPWCCERLTKLDPSDWKSPLSCPHGHCAVEVPGSRYGYPHPCGARLMLDRPGDSTSRRRCPHGH